MDEPFDARRSMLLDRSSPPEAWRPCSLVTALRAALGTEPDAIAIRGASRDRALRSVIAELTSRGLDADSLVRFGMGPEIVMAVLETVKPDWLTLDRDEQPLAQLSAGAGHRGAGGESTADPQAIAWRSLVADGEQELVLGLDITPQTTVPQIHAFVSKLVKIVLPWIFNAPLDNIVALTPPTPEEAAAYDRAPMPPENVLNEYRWAVERFSSTHLNEWSTSSLHLEYLWTKQRHPAPCCSEMMEDREVSLERFGGRNRSPRRWCEGLHRRDRPSGTTFLVECEYA